ncbi:gluconokinase [Paracoccus benzoatiresistens]|uniref:Gluconokinase n=1 Tax=Paracoccus benzoatiresistens TaxID=2997341 RepID=A0ABT4J412_9RHOB|nr:gluconokinase [Paracoccus sp. EF6]MCZ0961362.1 gluconokinase [Paracoccus sp. EF6]
MQRCILVMGPSGVGKSSLAKAIAGHLNAAFIEGDDYHPPGNRAAMAAGRPLDDAMRRPWLLALAEAVRLSAMTRETVFACSALKRSYRDILRDRIGPLVLVYPQAPAAVILARMQARDHFMPPAMLQSQLATLEQPGADEAAIRLDMTRPLDETVAEAIRQLSAR